LKQKRKDTFDAMQCKMRQLKDLDIQKKTEVLAAIKKWDNYFFSLPEHEVQFQVCV
jgi:hypothetical protein